MTSLPLDLNAVVFERDGRSYLFSGSSLYLFGVDPTTADVVSAARAAGSEADLIARTTPVHDPAEVRETLTEIERLIAADVLAPRGATLRPAGEDPGLTGETVALTDLWLIVTNSCNLNCAYCFSRAEYMKDHRPMSIATAKAGVDFLMARRGAETELTIVFFGGEPLLDMPLIRAVVAHADELAARHGLDIQYSMTTNGVKLTPAVRRWLIEKRFSVMISLDGEQPQHDASRPFLSGKGSFSTIVPRVKAFVAEAKAAGLTVNGRTTLNRTHLGHVVDLYRFMDEEMGFSNVSTPIIHEPAPPGFAFRMDDVSALEAELRALADVFVDKCRTEGRVPHWGTLSTFLHTLHHRARPARGCAAGRRAVCVDVDGEIYPCERFITVADYAVGRIGSTAYDMEKVHALSRLDAVGYYDKCRSCAAVYYCKGTCAAERARYHPPEGPDEITCEIYRALLRVVLDIYVRIDHDALLPSLMRHDRAA